MLDGSILDSKKVECFAKYANDAEGFSSIKSKNNSKISLDENDKVCLVALRNIKIGEEIFCSFGKKYWNKFSLIASKIYTIKIDETKNGETFSFAISFF